MKKIMMIAAMMVAALSANAQNEVGQVTLKPMVGLNIASMSKADNSKVRVGVAAGVEAEYGIAENLGVSAGVFYSQQGVKSNDEWGAAFTDETNGLIGGWAFEGKTTVKLDYINIPILAQFYPVKGLAIKAGIQPGFNVLKKVALDGTAYQASVQGGNAKKVDESYKINEGVKGFQFAIPVGISYEYESFVLDARYNIGVTKAFKGSDSRHSVFSITLGYKFAL